MTTQVRAARYRRVSTMRQAKEGASLEVQDAEVPRFIERQGWIDSGLDFEDPGESGAFFERKGLLAALAAADRGEIEVLVAYNLDRFSRGVWAQLTAAAEEVGLRLVTVDGVIDTDDDDREFPADMLDAVAKHQRKQTVKRSMASRAHRVRSGHWVGGVAPYGHRIVKGADGRGSRLEVNEDERVAVERAVVLLLDERRPPKEAAAILNSEGFTKRGRRWDSRNLLQALSKTTLAGRFVYGKERRARTRYDAAKFGVEGHVADVPSVIPPERWDALQALLDTVRWKKQTAHAYPLSGRIVTEDGHTYTGRFDTSNRKRRYRCRERYEYSRPGRDGGAPCSHREVSADKIERAVWDALMSELRSPRMEELFGIEDDLPTDAEAAQDSKERLTKQIARLQKDRLDVEARGLREGFSKAAIQQTLDEIDSDIATAEIALAEADAWAENARAREEQHKVLASYEVFAMQMNTPDEALMQRVFEAFDVRVVLTDPTRGVARIEVNAPLDPGSEYLFSDLDRRSVGDVYTTGATVGSAATELRLAGARAVHVVTFARAVRR